jgi:hypothetical protein
MSTLNFLPLIQSSSVSFTNLPFCSLTSTKNTLALILAFGDFAAPVLTILFVPSDNLTITANFVSFNHTNLLFATLI